MKFQVNFLEQCLQSMAGERFRKIFYVDFSSEEYQMIPVGKPLGDKPDELKSFPSIDQVFRSFADSPFCYEEDREQFREFTSLKNLRNTFEKNGYQKVAFLYRRKYSLTDPVFSFASMVVFPLKTENGDLTALFFVTDVTRLLRRYREEHAVAFSETHISGKRTILIVEDNDLNREILSEILETRYQVLQAENGAVGLKILQERMNEIAVVILDVQMPVMNGYEFLEIIRKDPFLSEIPIVVATGNNGTEEESKCLSLGAADFVSKPYNPDIILSRIAGVIRLKESAATLSMLQTDERTGLYTAQAFYYHARRMIDKEPDKSFTMFLLDVDHFRQIQERYGDESTNRLIHQISDVVKEHTLDSELNGRIGSDRFIFLKETTSREEMIRWVEMLFEALQKKCFIKGISFKVGIHTIADRSLAISLLCERANTAAQSIGQQFESRYAFYDEELAEKEHRLSIMETGMKEAYHLDQFLVYYQPKHDALTGKLVGAEALIRWIHPELGFLSPGEFIPLFERNGFIVYSDYYVLRRTCMNLKKWKEEGIKEVPISINVSRRDFDVEENLEAFSRNLNEFRIDPSLIHLEVTESLFSERIEELGQILQKCRDGGVQIEIDDFGSGYSSLATLASLPLDVVKLDMSFMKNIKDEKKMKVLATCVDLAKRLGMKTVAEGVENREQLELLKQMGCDWIQGYYYSKPLPEEAFRKYLQTHEIA